jgi:hypothetical protein
MSDEITHNAASGLNLYACRFQANGDVFVTDGSSDEVWGTGGHTADTYDVALTEEDSSGHYKADFDASGNIAAGHYYVVVYLQAGANPSDSDVAIAQGSLDWDGSAEITLATLTDNVKQIRRYFGAWR